MKEIQLLKKFIHHAPNNRLELVSFLGLRSTSTPSKWIERNQIPWRLKEKVNKYIEEYFDGPIRQSRK
jgi:hypothetical protein